MVYGYIRVSTEEQNLENQKKAITERFEVDKWVEEKKSGTIDYRKRNLGELIKSMTEGDVLVVTELSRLGRSLTMVFNIIEQLKEKKMRCVAIKNNFDMRPADSNDIVSSVLLFAFGLSAQIERQLISERTKQGLAVARSRGKRIGRQKGEMVYNVKLRPYQDDIMTAFKNGASINSLSRKYQVKWSTMQRFIKYFSKPKKHGHPTKAEIEWFETHA